jgi:hypothetical protein
MAGDQITPVALSFSQANRQYENRRNSSQNLINYTIPLPFSIVNHGANFFAENPVISFSAKCCAEIRQNSQIGYGAISHVKHYPIMETVLALK